LLIIKKELIRDYYDLETGFIRKQTNNVWML